MMPLTAFCNIDTLLELLKPVLLALSLSSLAVYAGMLFLVFALLKLSQNTRLSAYAKGAKQLAFIRLIFAWFILVTCRVWLYFFPGQLLEYCWFAMAGTVLLQSLHYSLWKKMAKAHTAAFRMTILSSALLSLTLAALMAFLIRQQIATALPSFQLSWGILSPFCDLEILKGNRLYLGLISTCIFVLLALPASAAWGAFCLPLLKKSQNFGRDHYKMLVARCSAWARNTWGILWLFQYSLMLAGCWFLWKQSAMPNGATLTVGCVWQLCWLIPISCWHRISKSTQPLRHKVALFVALLISISLF